MSRPAVSPTLLHSAPPPAASAGTSSPLPASSPRIPSAGTSPGTPTGVATLPGGQTGTAALVNPGFPRANPAEIRAAAAGFSAPPKPDVAVVPRPAPPLPALVPEASQGKESPPASQGAAPAVAGDVPPSPKRAPEAASAEPSSPPEDAATSSVPIRLRDPDPSIHSPYGIHEDGQTLAHIKATQKKGTAQTQELVVTRTVWHPSAERRVAVVRGPGDSQEREVHEGDSVGPLEVLRIEPSDVVFLHNGVEIRQRVGTPQ
jgi:hypothetical protein